MTRRYAEDTTVTIGTSKGEIEAMLDRHGATAFASAWDRATNRSLIGFEMGGRRYQISLVMPDRESFRYTPSRGLERSDSAVQEAYAQACRQRWRALALVIRAKLEATIAGITTVEQEFLAATILPDGQTVGDWAPTEIPRAYATLGTPRLLSGRDG